MKNSAPIHLASSIATSPPGFVTDHLVVLGEKIFAFKDELSSKSR